MRTLIFTSLLASVVAQTISGAVAAGSSVSWENPTTWGGVIPTGSAAVTINTGVTVTVSSAVSFVTGTTLTLGAIGTTGTQLILNDTGTFTAYAFTWANGHVVINGNSNFACVFSATLSGGSGAQDRQLIGGNFTLGDAVTGGSLVTVSLTGGSVGVNGSSLNSQGGTWAISSQAALNFTAGVVSWVTSDVTFNGGGNVSIQGELQNNASISIGTSGLVSNNPCVTWVWGNFTLTASGQATVAAGSNLIVAAGGRLKRANANADAMISVAASGTLEFAAGTTSWLDSNIDASGNIVVDAAATTTVSASSTITGSGSLNISGTFIANAAVNVGVAANAAIQTVVYAGGTLTIAAGNAVTFGATTLNNNSTWNLAFATANNVGTFAAVTVQGALALGGTINVNVPVQPSATVTLITAASITGFSSANVVTAGASAGRRLLGSSSGSVQQSGNTITYTPPASSPASAATVSFILAPLFAALAL